MSKLPLAEVFGFPADSTDENAVRHRDNRLCPFHNVEPNCTKDRKADPLGVCSIIFRDKPVVVCPVRFREDWIIAEDAARFLFPAGTKWTTLSEVGLKDATGESIGKMDFVLVAYDETGLITDYGALEAQAVYISGNLRGPFETYMKSPAAFEAVDWSKLVDPPKADFLSSRKRLIPQLIAKSHVLRKWGRKMVVATDTEFFNSLPTLPSMAERTADLAWHVYELHSDAVQHRYRIQRRFQYLTDLRDAVVAITEPKIGDERDFLAILQKKLASKLGQPTKRRNAQ